MLRVDGIDPASPGPVAKCAIDEAIKSESEQKYCFSSLFVWLFFANLFFIDKGELTN